MNLLEQARGNLKYYWGYPDFRVGQDQAVESVLGGNETVVLFPTGGGKSLCYQVPATVFEGMTVVISPLVALMQDQVDQLKAKGVPATFINSTIPKREVEQRLINARNHMYKLMYCAPERLETELWQNIQPELPIEMIAVDEAHCISEWGHDFRPSYRTIKDSVEPVSRDVKWMALTATATPEVRDDIISSLKLEDPTVISLGFERPNLKWWVLEDQQKEKRLLDTVKKAKGNGLIYAGTRNGCENLAGRIEQQGIKCRAYHAGLSSQERETIQHQWIKGEVPLVVATNAFGMGIDKSDCRYVIHYDMPYSIEAYYQEAGRAGRDGKESYPILLFRQNDYPEARKRIEESYPERKELITVYNALCDYWETAVGTQPPDPLPVDYTKIATRSSLSQKVVRAAIRILDRLGLIELLQHHQQKIGVRFAVTQGGLRDAIRRTPNPRKADFLDRLGRLFGPSAFLAMENLELDYLKQKLELPANSILRGLNVLQQEQILIYQHIKDEPLGTLAVPRYRIFPFSAKELERHRNTLLEKLERMAGYAKTQECRSRFLRIYFGEDNVPRSCGKCDICLREQRNVDPVQANKAILGCIESTAHSLDEIKQKTGLSKQVLRDGVQRLLREEVITRIEEERIRYLKK